MLKICYKKQDNFFWGIQQLEKIIPLRNIASGIVIHAEQTEEKVSLEKDGNEVIFKYRREHEFWFLLTRLYLMQLIISGLQPLISSLPSKPVLVSYHAHGSFSSPVAYITNTVISPVISTPESVKRLLTL